jgi:hypothetical protein
LLIFFFGIHLTAVLNSTIFLELTGSNGIFGDISDWFLLRNTTSSGSQHNDCDGDQRTALKDLVQVPIGPVTRARAKKFKDVLNGLIQELWAQANSWRPIEHDPRGQQRIVTLIQVLEGSGQG